VVDAKVLDHILRLFKSPNPDTRESASILVGNLASHKSTTPAVLKLNLSVQLVSLLGWTRIFFLQHSSHESFSDEDHVVRWATYALSQISRWADGAKAMVDAKALDHVLPLLESPNPDVRKQICVLVKGLASHEATARRYLAAETHPPARVSATVGVWNPYTPS
jgi:hypothetical protein